MKAKRGELKSKKTYGSNTMLREINQFFLLILPIFIDYEKRKRWKNMTPIERISKIIEEIFLN